MLFPPASRLSSQPRLPLPMRTAPSPSPRRVWNAIATMPTILGVLALVCAWNATNARSWGARGLALLAIVMSVSLVRLSRNATDTAALRGYQSRFLNAMGVGIAALVITPPTLTSLLSTALFAALVCVIVLQLRLLPPSGHDLG